MKHQRGADTEQLLEYVSTGLGLDAEARLEVGVQEACRTIDLG